jgi:hypothetical protein
VKVMRGSPPPKNVIEEVDGSPSPCTALLRDASHLTPSSRERDGLSSMSDWMFLSL